MRRRPFLLALAALAATGAAAPPTAHAQVAWAPCTDRGFAAFQCGRVAVALDRSGRAPGTVELFARRLVAPENPDRSALVVLAGGPGQPATPRAAGVAVALAPALGRRDLLVFDQRGTGASHPLRCESLRRRRISPRAAAVGCANELGGQRAFFRTSDSVADIEDLRAAAGYERLVLMGTSYGTKVALGYAARHPQRVESLVLDSVVTPEGPDVFKRSSFAASARVLRKLCGGGRCTRTTPDPVADVRRIVRRETIRGRYVAASGRVRTGRMGAGALFDVLQAGDVNPAWRALLPGAVRAAVLGDEAPLLRLGSTALEGGGLQVPASGVNEALFLATICEELAFPWDRAAGAEGRLDQAVRALRGIPESAFAPFDSDVGAHASLVGLCYGWPNAAPPPETPPALPRVPALVLSGEADLRTPLEDARSVAERLGVTPVSVPHVGHSVLGSDVSECARAAVAAFFRDGSTPPCPPDIQPAISPLPRPPRSLREVPRARAYGGRVGRTLNAVAFTRDDALTAALGARLGGLRRVAGVRRGTIAIGSPGVSLRGVELVPGVRVTGVFPNEGDRARLRVTGRAAARGHLTLTRGGSVSGRLGGRRISARPRAAGTRGPFGGPASLRRVVRFPALVRP